MDVEILTWVLKFAQEALYPLRHLLSPYVVFFRGPKTQNWLSRPVKKVAFYVFRKYNVLHWNIYIHKEEPIYCFRFLNPRISFKGLTFKFENQIKKEYVFLKKDFLFFPRIPAIPCLGVHQKHVSSPRTGIPPPLHGSMRRKHFIFQDESGISLLSTTGISWVL